MTDITRLIQEMKAAAEKAKHAGEAPVMPFDTRISTLNEYQLTVCPDNVLALVEALELKEEQRANWFQMAQKLGEDLDAAEKRNAELEREHENLRPVGVMSEKGYLAENERPSGGNSPANDITNGKPFTITLPDISSKAFWSGTGKAEVFHPETYRRWAKEAIERYCAIARIDVEVK